MGKLLNYISASFFGYTSIKCDEILPDMGR